MSTLISAQQRKFSAIYSRFLLFACFPTRIYLITVFFVVSLCSIVSLSNLLRFYCTTDLWIIKSFFSTLARKATFLLRLLLTHWVEMLILTIIYTQSERTGKFTEVGSVTMAPCGHCKWLRTCFQWEKFPLAIFIHKFKGKLTPKMKTMCWESGLEVPEGNIATCFA